MAALSSHPRLRWLAPVTALALVGGGGALASTAAGADPGLPAKSAEQLLVDLQESQEDSFSGTVAAETDLGLGVLAGVKKRTTDFTNLVDGESTLRVWADGPSRQRVALVGEGGEAAVVRDGRTVWTWNAQEQRATKLTLPAHDATEREDEEVPDGMPRTPQEAARLLLDRLDPTTRVSTTGTATVAGRDAYELVLTPRTSDTLVRTATVAVDAQTSMPLRVQVFGSDPADPAIDIGYTSLDLATPARSTFAFTPPDGATVTTRSVPKHTGTNRTVPQGSASRPALVGEGWASVAVTRVPAGAVVPGTGSAPGGADGAANPADLLAAIPVQRGDWGSGRVVEGTLFSAVLTEDGRVAVGAVPASGLFDALRSTKGAASSSGDTAR